MEVTADSDQSGPPRIKKVSAKIGALERRCEFLEGQIERGEVTGSQLDFIRAERKALDAAIQALKFHRAEVEGLDQPILALQELVDAMGQHAVDTEARPSVPSPRVVQAFRRAETVLKEWVG